MERTCDLVFRKDFFQALECPVCLEVPTPPVTLCRRARHFICGFCRHMLDRCLICNDVFTDIRCYAVENIAIASKVNVKCPYKPCQTTQSIAKIGEHLERCDYRPVICNGNTTTCGLKNPIDFDKFVDHLKEAHGAETVSVMGLEPSCILLPDWIKEVVIRSDAKTIPCGNTLYTFDGVTFILNIAKEGEAVFIWVSAMLPKSKCLTYSTDIHIGQGDMQVDGVWKISCDPKNIKWTGGVVPVHVPLKDIKESRDCVKLPVSRMIALSRTNQDGIPTESPTVFIEVKFRKV